MVSQTRGNENPRGTPIYYSAFFSRKVHVNETHLDYGEWGWGRPSAVPPKSGDAVNRTADFFLRIHQMILSILHAFIACLENLNSSYYF